MTDNELIAEFMGYRKIEGSHLYRDPDSTVYVSDARDFAYHYRWDWLMPVVEKIDSIDLPNIEISIGKFKTTFTTQGSTVLSYYNKQHGGKIGATYKAVVEFIKWYNQNKNS